MRPNLPGCPCTSGRGGSPCTRSRPRAGERGPGRRWRAPGCTASAPPAAGTGSRRGKRKRARCHTSQPGSDHPYNAWGGCIKKKQNCYNDPPVSREVSEVLVIARVAVGRGGVTLTVKPAALQRRLLIPDADGAHLRWPQPPSRDNLTAELTCFDNDHRIMASCGQCTVRLSFTEFPKLTNFVHWMNDLGFNPSSRPCEIPFMQRCYKYNSIQASL